MYPFIILCGGLATRLGEIAVETPKCLLTLNEKPFLFYQLDYLDKNGAKDVFLSVGHLSDQFYDFVQHYTFSNINIRLIEDGSEPLGTGGAVKNIITEINSPCFVMYGDSFLRIKFNDAGDESALHTIKAYRLIDKLLRKYDYKYKYDYKVNDIKGNTVVDIYIKNKN